MSQFTQLNLDGSSGNQPVQAPAKPVSSSGKVAASGKSTKKHSSTTTATAIGVSLAAAAVVAALTLGTNACSKSTQAIAAPAAPSPVTQAASTPPAPMTAISAPSPKTARKHSREHILFAYKNADYGISFLYPKGYRIRKGEKANLEWIGLGPLGMNFVQPGGETLAAVRLPGNTFPGTDFVSGFFNVSVDPKVTSEQCAEFAFEDDKQGAAAASMSYDYGDPAAPSELKKVKFGATEFNQAKGPLETRPSTPMPSTTMCTRTTRAMNLLLDWKLRRTMARPTSSRWIPIRPSAN